MLEIACNNCVAACCKNVILELTRKEQKFMERGGSNLVTVAKPKQRDRSKVPYPRSYEVIDGEVKLSYVPGYKTEPLKAGLGRFVLIGNCGYLETDPSGWELCSVYSERPQVCQDFPVGESKCQLMRVSQGVDSPSEEVPDLRDLLEPKDLS